MPRHRSLTTAIAVLLFATPLAAQRVTENAAVQNAAPVTAPAPVAALSAEVERPPSLAPTRANVTVGVRASATANTLVLTPVPVRNSRNTAMMVVGGVALLGGALMQNDAGTIIMIAGGALGLYGLWQYLQ